MIGRYHRRRARQLVTVTLNKAVMSASNGRCYLLPHPPLMPTYTASLLPQSKPCGPPSNDQHYPVIDLRSLAPTISKAVNFYQSCAWLTSGSTFAACLCSRVVQEAILK